jgi:hypothetical protein
MIHTMEECVVKLKAIKTISKKGIEQAKQITETYRYEQILQEVNYLINETREKGK